MNNQKERAIQLLADGFAGEFAETVASDDRFHELLMDMAIDFVNKEIPITDEDASYDVAYQLCNRVSTGKF